MNQEKQAFFERYAPLAIEQQRKYGIPASVTLSQMALESGWGKSALSQECNNYFGVKATASWLKEGKPYRRYSDDKPNEAFKKYGSVEESITDHSKVLTSKRYASLQNNSVTDYKSWANGLQRAGYATDPSYASKLINTIEEYNLSEYDKKAALMGRLQVSDANAKQLTYIEGNWSMPLTTNNDKLIMTCDYGDTKYHKNGHNGIDLRANEVPCFATEDKGVVTAAKFDKNGGGNFVCVEYNRPDGTKYEVEYLHLKEIKVDLAQQVNAGDTLGITGNTGRSSAPHLDFRVKKDGQWIDPKEYLAEIAVRGNMPSELVAKGNENGTDLLAQHKAGMSVGNEAQQQNDTPDNSKEQSFGLESLLANSLGQGGGGGLFSNLISMIFMMALTVSKNSKDAGMKDVTHDVSADALNSEEGDGVVMRKDGTLDPSLAKQNASMLYERDTDMQLQNQQQGVHLS